MSNPTPDAAAPQRSSLAGLLRASLIWLGKNPVIGAGAVFVSALIIGGVTTATWVFLAPEHVNPEERFAEALRKLDEHDYPAARKLAAELREYVTPDDPKVSGPLYVFGAVLAHDAEQHWSPAEQKTLYLVAARYLEESRLRGFPEGREVEGTLLLGRCLYRGGRFAAAISVLRSLVHPPAEQMPELLAMLADCYLHLSPPRLDKALEQNEQLLALPNLSVDERDRALLLKGNVLLEQHQLAQSREAFQGIGKKSHCYAEAQIELVRLTLLEAKHGNDDSAPPPDYSDLLQKLDAIQKRSDLPAPTIAKAQLLMGLCYKGQGDTDEAITQFGRIRSTHMTHPEAIIASLYEGELLQQQDSAEEAARLYLRLLEQAGSAETYSNSWLPLNELDRRLRVAFDGFVAGNDYSQAVELATAMGPLLSEVRSCEMRARAEYAWAENLEKQAAEQSDEADVTRAEARVRYREAGAEYERLADLRIATRFYLDDLALSGQSYLLGHGFRQAAAVFRKLIAQNSSTRTPEALRGLGEALLATGDIDGALAALTQCRENYPHHPATYRARLLASQVYEEKGQIDLAREMLSDNLYRFALTPQSSEWRDSLFALGALLYRDALGRETRSRIEGIDSGDVDRQKSALKDLETAYALFQEAIKTLNEAVQRYPQDRQTIEARYEIAESHRHSAKWARKRLGIVTIETTRVSLNRQMQRDLQAAIDGYASLIAELADEQDTQRTPLEKAIVRNSYFARGDALFDLGRFEEAIKAYSAATNRYQHEPEALEAYVQIAACYRRLDRPAEARVTLEQARVVLQRIRPDADFARTTRWQREEWNQLLAWLVTL